LNRHQEETLNAIVRILSKARSVLFITGAGVSADSGVPTYRGIGGLYNVDTTEEGYAIEECLSAEMFAREPQLTWKYLAQIGKAAQGAQFNRAHEVMALMEGHFHRVWTLTQNVDGFHKAAGSKNLIEVHGNMNSFSCTRCSWTEVVGDFEKLPIPPLCPECEQLIRPDVVLFGEMLMGPAVDEMQRQVETGFEVVFSIGTSSVFPYIQAPVHAANRVGNVTVEINPCETTLSHVVDYRLDMGAAEAMDQIWKRLNA
jgi:NAD-dependent deacetylase